MKNPGGKLLPFDRLPTSMGDQLAHIGQPLSSAQQKSLTAAVINEDERTRNAMESLTRRFNPGSPQDLAQLQEEATKLKEEQNRRILDAVGSGLNAQQLEYLRKQYGASQASQAFRP